MKDIDWAREFSVAITVTDINGKIVYLNDKSGATFGEYGGMDLLGRNLRDCHKPESWEKITSLLETDQPNCYTIEKEGTKKLIFQAPWYDRGKKSGLVELSVEIPFVMEHFIRK